MTEKPIFNPAWAKYTDKIEVLPFDKVVLSYTIETTVDPVKGTVIVDQRTGTGSAILRYIAETKENRIRKGLIALGWTPPPKTGWFHRLFNLTPVHKEVDATQPVSGQGSAGAGEGENK